MKRSRVEKVEPDQRPSAGSGREDPGEGGGDPEEGSVGPTTSSTTNTTHHHILTTAQHTSGQIIPATPAGSNVVPVSGDSISQHTVQDSTPFAAPFPVGSRSASSNTTRQRSGTRIGSRCVSSSGNVVRSGRAAGSVLDNIQAQPTSVAGSRSGGAVQQPRPVLRIQDAFTFLDQVKSAFSHERQTYNTFLGMIKGLRQDNPDVTKVIQQVAELFKGRTELIYGFNRFTPAGQKIIIPSDDDQGISVPFVSTSSTPGNTSGADEVPGPSGLCLARSTTSADEASSVHEIPTIDGADLITHTPSVTSATARIPSTTHSLPPAAVAVSTFGPPPQTVGAPQHYSGPRKRTLSQSGNSDTPNPTSEPSPHGHTLHHIQQAHRTLMLAESSDQQSQPEEFDDDLHDDDEIK